MQLQWNRRKVLSAGLKAAAVAPLILPQSAKGANDRLTYALIGSGNRGRGLNRAFQTVGAVPVAISDVYKPHLELGVKESPKGVATFLDYGEMLAKRSDIDFVVSATPDHQHKPTLAAGLAAKKDVYLEKPLSMTMGQSAEMVKMVRATDRIVQIGMQRRSMDFIYKAKALIDSGRLGKVHMVKATWNWHFNMPLSMKPLEGELDWMRFQGSAPKHELIPPRFRWWRGYWDYSGGNMTDQGTHLMDVVQWMMGAQPPISAYCAGARVDVPVVEVPNIFDTIFEYPNFMATWTLNYRTSFDYDWAVKFLGDEASMVLDRLGARVYQEPPAKENGWPEGWDLKVVEHIKDDGKYEAHMANFVECVKSRKEPNCPIEKGAEAVCGPHMANLSYRQEKKIRRNADATAAS